jgi:hypothetical protein
MGWQDDPVISQDWRNDPVAGSAERRADPTEGMSGGEKFFAGMGKAFVDVGRAIGQPLGIVSQEDVEESRRLDAPLMRTGAGIGGNLAGGLAAFGPLAAAPGANTLAGAALYGAVIGGGLSPGSLQERAENAAFGAAGGAAGQAIGSRVANWAANRVGSRNAAAALAEQQNAVRDATLQAGQRAGYVVPPSTTNPSMMNRVVEGMAGKINTQQTASIRNQGVTNHLAREALGLADDVPLTKESLRSIRTEAGKVYEQVAQAGRVNISDDYKLALLGLRRGADLIAKDFPDLDIGGKDAIIKLTESLDVPSFDARSAVEVIKGLRHDASQNMAFNVADPARKLLGIMQREAATIVEDELSGHLAKTNQWHLAEQFAEARTLIAKVYTVESALNPATGNVAAASLSRQLSKGKPLSGELRTAAEFGRAFPKATREVNESMPGISPLDVFTGAGLGAITGEPLTMVAPAAVRMGARAAQFTGPYQRMMTAPNYTPGRLGTMGLDAVGGAGHLGMPIGGLAGLLDWTKEEREMLGEE